jgi:hypothetical protein
MMKERIRSRDLRLLSEYLDSRLSETQTRKFEARLAEDSALRERLENLRKTKLMLSRLSRVKAPRHFTLTPEMVKVRRQKKQPMVLAMRWATTVAAILLVVMFGADLIFRSPIIGQPKMQAAAPAMESMALSADSVVDEEAANAEATPEPLILWGAAGSGGGGEEPEAIGMGGGFGSGGGGTEEPVIEPPVPTEAAPEEVPTGPLETMPQDTRIASKEAGDSPILGVNPEQGGEIISTSEAAAAPASATWFASLTALEWLEIALAVIVLGTGVTWLILRKR